VRRLSISPLSNPEDLSYNRTSIFFPWTTHDSESRIVALSSVHFLYFARLLVTSMFSFFPSLLRDHSLLLFPFSFFYFFFFIIIDPKLLRITRRAVLAWWPPALSTELWDIFSVIRNLQKKITPEIFRSSFVAFLLVARGSLSKRLSIMYG